MEKISINANPPNWEDSGFSVVSLQRFDLPRLIERIKHDSTWINGDLNSTILSRSPNKQVVLAAMHENSEIRSFQADESVTFQIIEGKLKFHTRDESVTLEKGQWLTLHKKMKYSLSSKEETVFVLTIANGTFQPEEN